MVAPHNMFLHLPHQTGQTRFFCDRRMHASTGKLNRAPAKGEQRTSAKIETRGLIPFRRHIALGETSLKGTVHDVPCFASACTTVHVPCRV